MTRIEALEAVRSLSKEAKFVARMLPNAQELAACAERVDEALAALAAAPDDGWRPIEMAPKDGEDTLLLYKPDEPRSGETLFAGYWSDEPIYGVGWVPIAGAHVIKNVTHWRPLPAPPAPQTSEYVTTHPDAESAPPDVT